MKFDRCQPKFNSDFPANFQKYSGIRSQCNPGNFEEFHYLAHRLKPSLFDGIVLDYIHRLSPNKSIIANYILSHNKPSGFRFGGIYNVQIYDDVLETPTVHADINPSTLSTNISLLYYPLRCLRMEADLQRASDNDPLKTQFAMELSTNTSTITANVYDGRSERGRATLSVLQSVSHHLSAGSELLLEWTDYNTIMTNIAVAARYKRHAFSVAATASRQGIDITYWRRIHRQLQVASLWAWQPKANKSVGTICYQLDLKDAYVKGMLDSNLSLGVMYSRYLRPVPLNMAFSLFVNLHTNRFIFGVKLVLDPRGLQRSG